MGATYLSLPACSSRFWLLGIQDISPGVQKEIPLPCELSQNSAPTQPEMPGEGGNTKDKNIRHTFADFSLFYNLFLTKGKTGLLPIAAGNHQVGAAL